MLLRIYRLKLIKNSLEYDNSINNRQTQKYQKSGKGNFQLDLTIQSNWISLQGLYRLGWLKRHFSAASTRHNVTCAFWKCSFEGFLSLQSKGS